MISRRTKYSNNFGEKNERSTLKTNLANTSLILYIRDIGKYNVANQSCLGHNQAQQVNREEEGEREGERRWVER